MTFYHDPAAEQAKAGLSQSWEKNHPGREMPEPDADWTGRGDPWKSQRPPDESGISYAGGSRWFDEDTGEYSPPPMLKTGGLDPAPIQKGKKWFKYDPEAHTVKTRESDTTPGEGWKEDIPVGLPKMPGGTGPKNQQTGSLQPSPPALVGGGQGTPPPQDAPGRQVPRQGTQPTGGGAGIDPAFQQLFSAITAQPQVGQQQPSRAPQPSQGTPATSGTGNLSAQMNEKFLSKFGPGVRGQPTGRIRRARSF